MHILEKTNNIHPCWRTFLTENEKLLHEIESKLTEKELTPVPENIFRFIKQNIYDVKIIILGQDPYPSIDKNGLLVANGRSFQPDNLLDWNQSFRQVSLKNIIRAVYSTYNIPHSYKGIKSYKEISQEISNGSFTIKKPKDWFDSLEKQGVLFLNRSLTTEIGNSNAHEDIWREFSNNLILFIAHKNPNIIWFLWGANANEVKYMIPKSYCCRHPMMCSNKYPDDFLKCNCFRDTANIINWLG